MSFFGGLSYKQNLAGAHDARTGVDLIVCADRPPHIGDQRSRKSLFPDVLLLPLIALFPNRRRSSGANCVEPGIQRVVLNPGDTLFARKTAKKPHST